MSFKDPQAVVFFALKHDNFISQLVSNIQQYVFSANTLNLFYSAHVLCLKYFPHIDCVMK